MHMTRPTRSGRPLRRARLAVAAGTGHMLLAAWRAAPGLAGLGLLAYGAWLAWPPAGFITGGLAILADVVWSRVAWSRRAAG